MDRRMNRRSLFGALIALATGVNSGAIVYDFPPPHVDFAWIDFDKNGSVELIQYRDGSTWRR